MPKQATSGKDALDKPKDAFARLVEMVTRTPKTTAEVRKRLLREEFTEAEVSAALERGANCLLLNDEAYAQSFALSRKGRGYGALRIKRDLLLKGIDVTQYAFWEEFLGEFAGESEFDEALLWARGHMPASKHPARSLYASLMRRGYSSATAFRVLQELGLDPYHER